MNKFISIAKNTFKETIRQPIYAVIITAALILLCISPGLTMYSMSEDNKLLREIGLSTLFLTSLFISIFAASGSVGEEIDNKTILTVVTKPVPRPIFILAKFAGVALAVALAHYICTVGMLFAIRHGVMSTVAETFDWTVIISAVSIVLLSVILSAFFNYTYEWNFSSTAMILLACFSTISMIFLTFIDKEWQFNPASNGFNSIDVFGSLLLFFAALILVAISVAISTRFSLIVTLSACIGVFLLGLVNDYFFGQLAQHHFWAKIGRYLIPNLQVFWISDAIYEGSTVPLKYIFISSCYAISYTIGILMLAIALFQRRQVG
jgi:ABC-2 type transport system permease protein